MKAGLDLFLTDFVKYIQILLIDLTFVHSTFSWRLILSVRSGDFKFVDKLGNYVSRAAAQVFSMIHLPTHCFRQEL